MNEGRPRGKSPRKEHIPFRLTLMSALAVLCLGTGCMKKTYNLNRVRTQLEAFNQELGEAYYDNYAYGKTLQITQIYDKYSPLLANSELITYVRNIRDRARNPLERRRLAYLHRELLGHYLGQRTKQITEKVTNIQTSITIALEEQEIAFRQVPGRLMNEKDRERRKKLYRAQGALIVEQLNPPLREELELLGELARELGYEDFAHLQESARGDDFNRLEKMAQDFLEQTEDIFRELVQARAYQTLGLQPEDVRGWDRPRMYRAQEYDRYFPKEKLLPLMRSSLSRLGLELEEQKSIVIDAEDRAQKASRAACFPIAVPQDIRVLIQPVGSIRDYQALFHQMGHALYYANIRTGEYEFRWLGDVAVTETFAFLMENLFMDRIFLEEYTGIGGSDLNHLLQNTLFHKLRVMRLYCGKFLYETKLHQNVSNPIDNYGQLMERATLLPGTTEENRIGYLLYGNEEFHTVDYIKAWFLEAQLRFHLREQFGPRWFERREAGEYLKELWALGSAKPAEILAQHLGFDGIELSFLMRQLEHLQRPDQASTEGMAGL